MDEKVIKAMEQWKRELFHEIEEAELEIQRIADIKDILKAKIEVLGEVVKGSRILENSDFWKDYGQAMEDELAADNTEITEQLRRKIDELNAIIRQIDIKYSELKSVY